MLTGRLIRDDRGVTLVELIVVLVIVSAVIIMAAVSPGFVGTERVNKVSRELLGDLQNLRHSAMTQGPDGSATALRGYGVRFESEHSYRIFRFNDSDVNFMYNGQSEEAALPGESAPLMRRIPAPAVLKIKDNKDLVVPVDTVLIFDRHGIPRQRTMGFQLMS
ncbi:MAG TPA: prepilin-type N-terminal cleavage/methylation domain-containing protein, partial [Thermodesulfovibrionales bacterium]|nr:prepilin-type N-terminal cleavage/methylation domain-containing protein [Thermodesulfovibrionales bacterium]